MTASADHLEVLPIGTARNGEKTLSRKEAVSHLGRLGLRISVRTLAKYAVGDNKKRGPPFIRFRGRFRGYRPTDLETWCRRELSRVE